MLSIGKLKQLWKFDLISGFLLSKVTNLEIYKGFSKKIIQQSFQKKGGKKLVHSDFLVLWKLCHLVGQFILLHSLMIFQEEQYSTF
jgi:hypothetical protein